MRIGMQTWGSDGDIRPFIALAGGLSAAQHKVTLVVTSADGKNYQHWADKLQFEIIHTASPFSGDLNAFNEAAALVVDEANPATELRILLNQFFVPVVEDMYEAAKNLAQTNNLIIRHFLHYPALVAAKKFKIPDISVYFMHGLTPTSYKPPGGLPNLGRFPNKILWGLAEIVIKKNIKPFAENLFSKENVIVPKDVIKNIWASCHLNLIAVSKAFCEGFADWDEKNCVGGFLSMPLHAESVQLDDALKNFISQGAAPVYFTFGSLLPHKAEFRRKTINLFIKAIRKINARAIIQVFADDLPSLTCTRQVYYVAFAPHELIFPYCAAIVHHGGAGTTHAATRAGVPSIVIQHLGDQGFWGRELYRLKIAPRTLHRRTLTFSALQNSIHEVIESASMKKNAEKIGEFMRGEKGVETFVVHINNFIDGEMKRK